VILPLLTGVSCGGFFLYGSPIIYTQELEHTKDFYRVDNLYGGLNASKVYHNNSVIM
jgi:hypothetical protein